LIRTFGREDQSKNQQRRHGDLLHLDAPAQGSLDGKVSASGQKRKKKQERKKQETRTGGSVERGKGKGKEG